MTEDDLKERQKKDCIENMFLRRLDKMHKNVEYYCNQNSNELRLRRVKMDRIHQRKDYLKKL